MRVEIRRAVIGDERLLRDLRAQALTDAPEAFGSTLERELARTVEDWRKWFAPGVTFFVLVDGEPRGLVAGVNDTADRSVVHLMAMWVAPAIRRSGAADLLVNAVKDWAAESGANELRLNVVESNDRARRCYERNGFRVTGQRGVVAKSGEAEIEMAWAVEKRSETNSTTI
jgi:ribosomal protein S18 acetylase RimI-like enzyme